jgi:hypothetical protein
MLLIAPNVFDPTDTTHPAAHVSALILWHLVQIGQFAIMTSASVTQYHGVLTGQLRPRFLVNIFVALVLTFAGTFFLVFLHNPEVCWYSLSLSLSF